ncbi:MAG TPA: tetratricopeptide repeat protein, partial [Acidimicrobiales bacterium]|nr:tetratricopeptide repeat protein [Acidimicrobiales bacterium]
RAMQQLVEHLALSRPLVLVISELHWADEVVLTLLERLLERLRGLPLVVVGTARPDLEDRWTPKAGRHNLLAVNLEALDRQAAANLLTALLGEDLDAGLREVLLDRSGGNPFFLEEMVSLLSDAGIVGDGDGEVARHPSGRPDIGALPATLRGLVAARLDALGHAERALLEDAAVMGPSGSIEALGTMAAARGDRAWSDVLERLVTKDLLATDDGNVGFRSDLVREVCYETLTKADRARRHATVAEWLAAHALRTEREDELLESIAHHFGAAAELSLEVGSVTGVPDDIVRRALDAVERAAERAEGRETLSLSIRLFDRALRLATGKDNEAVRRRLLVARARVKVTLRDLIGARDDVDGALESAREAGDATVEACALVVQGDAAQKEGRYAEAVEVLTRAVDTFAVLNDVRGLAGALRTLGMTRLFQGEKDMAADLVERSLAAFRDASDARGEAWALQSLAWIAFDRGDARTADQWLLPSIEKFKEIGDFGGLGWAVGLRAWVRFYLGHLDEALELGRQVCEEALDRGDRWGLAMMKSLVSHAELWKGEVAQAVIDAGEARRAFDGTGDSWGHLQANFAMARALAMLGRGSEARAVNDDAVAQLDGIEDAHQRDVMALLSVATLAHLGDVAGATVLTDRLHAAGRGGELGSNEAHATLALTRLQAGDAPAAMTLLGDVAGMDAGPAAWRNALVALAAVAIGDLPRASHAADTVIDGELGTFVDRSFALIARGFVELQQGSIVGASEAFDAAASLVDATDDRLDQAIVRLARAMAWEAAGSDDALAARTDADAALARLNGEPLLGWTTAFSLATAPHPRSAREMA